MREVLGGVVINEQESEPLSEYVIDFLTKNRKETPYCDFKLTLQTGKDTDFPEIVKDIFAFSNYGGGWILVGWKEYPKNQFTPVGLPKDYQLDQAVLQEKFNSYSEEPITLLYTEIKRDFRPLYFGASEEVKAKVNSVSDRFAIIFIPPYPKLLVPKKDGVYIKNGKDKVVFTRGDVYYRRGTQSIKNPSSIEMGIINKRLEKEGYRHSVLSGEPDSLEETIQSNIFEITQLPKHVFIGLMKKLDEDTITSILHSQGVSPDYYYVFKNWDGLFITYENLFDETNPYRMLVKENTIKKELVEDWLADFDKKRIIVELLKRSFIHYAIGKGMTYFEDKNKLYYSTISEERNVTWKSRYGTSTRTVVTKMFAKQVDKYVYLHVALAPEFLNIDNKFYVRIAPSFMITDNGINPIYGFTLGTIITRLTYGNYNSSYLNNVLFWVYQFGGENDIVIRDYLKISNKPVQLIAHVGILYDIPSSEFKVELEDEGLNIIDDIEGEE